MNTLSWVIYLVGFVEKIGLHISVPLVFSFAIGIISGIGFVFLKFFKADEPNIYYGDNAEAKLKKHLDFSDTMLAFSGKIFKYAAAIWVFFAFVNVVVPTKQIMILIAASEVSETVITSEAAQKTLNEVGGVGAEAIGLLKTYIAKEQASIAKELADITKKAETQNKEN